MAMTSAAIVDPAAVLLHTGPLGRAGGAVVIDGLPRGNTWDLLVDEAHGQFEHASRQDALCCDQGQPRARTPRRAMGSAPGGPVQDAFYRDPDLAEYISNFVGVQVVPSGGQGSFSYYSRPGDFLDLHLDVFACDIALITVLHDDSDPVQVGGSLAVYRERADESLESIRSSPDHGFTLTKPPAGCSVLLLGGVIPHRLLPMPAHGTRIVSPLCFRAVF